MTCRALAHRARAPAPPLADRARALWMLCQAAREDQRNWGAMLNARNAIVRFFAADPNPAVRRAARRFVASPPPGGRVTAAEIHN